MNNKATEIIKEKGQAVVLFTRGDQFIINDDGTGKTGNWKIRLDRQIEKVIIYYRPEKKLAAEVYKADVVQIKLSDEEGRSFITFQNAENLGETNLNWFEFADSGPNPVRYL